MPYRVLAGILLLVLAGCGEEVVSGTPSPTKSPAVSPTPTPTESPAATCDEPAIRKITVVAENFHFDVKCLAVPSGEALRVQFVNRDFVSHNLSIYTADRHEVVTGDVAYPAERFRYEVPALEAGEYLFRCDIHPSDMSGSLIAV